VHARIVALVGRSSQLRFLLLPLALGLSACQTMDDMPVSNSWNAAPLARARIFSMIVIGIGLPSSLDP